MNVVTKLPYPKELFPPISVGQFSDQEAARNYRDFFGQGANKYGIYPPGWSEQRYGRAPMLGIVHADDEFLAEKTAYDRDLYRGSTSPVVKYLGPAKRAVEYPQ